METLMGEDTSGLIIEIIVIAAAIFVLYKLWPRKGKMGINVESVTCPDCDKKLPFVRKPANIRQLLWGGYTCPACGCELDKYGHKIDK
jgi:hypothetical protein